MWIKSTSFNVWVRYFVWNFKGTLWNSPQNILPIHWKIWFLYNIEILRALRFKSSSVFLKRPPESRQTDRIMFRAIYQIHTKLLHSTLSNSPFEFHKKISHIQRYEFHTLLKIYELSDLRAHFMFLKCSHSNNVINIPPKLAIFMFTNQGKHFRSRRQQ